MTHEKISQPGKNTRNFVAPRPRRDEVCLCALLRFSSRGRRASQLHIEQSLAGIDFHDIEPSLLPLDNWPATPGMARPLVNNDLFEVTLRTMETGDTLKPVAGQIEILGVTEGSLAVEFDSVIIEMSAGQFCLIPAQSEPAIIRADSSVTFLQIRTP